MNSDLLATRYSLPATRHVATFNALHLGDNLIHLHFLRKMAEKYRDIHFTHGAPDQHLAQLYPLWQDLPNLTVKSIAEVGQGAINAWRGAGGWFYQQPDCHDFLAIHLRWFRELAKTMGLESPIHCAADMLFDYPALKAEVRSQKSEISDRSHPPDPSCDFLIVNSPPRSGQWSGFDSAQFFPLAKRILATGARVMTTDLSLYAAISTVNFGLDVTGIGKLSQSAKCIIGCVTGPMWPTLNIWNADTIALRVHLLDHERVDLAPNTVHANCLSLVPEILKDRGLI